MTQIDPLRETNCPLPFSPVPTVVDGRPCSTWTALNRPAGTGKGHGRPGCFRVDYARCPSTPGRFQGNCGAFIMLGYISYKVVIET